MSDLQETKESISDNLQQVISLLEKHKQQNGAGYSNYIGELQTKLDALHPADVAHILEALPLADRLDLWELVKADRDGDILLEVADSVRQSLIADMDSSELLAAAEQLDADELADLAPDLPKDVLQDLMDSLDAQNRERLQSTLSYPEEAVGAHMDFDIVTIREDITLEVALRYLRRLGSLP